jgi:hypothetical protein
MSYLQPGVFAYWQRLRFKWLILTIVMRVKYRMVVQWLISASQVYYTQKMGFLSDFWEGFKSVPVGIYDKVLEPVGSKVWGVASNSLDNINRINGAVVGAAEGVGKGVQGLGDILSGNSNFLMYAGIALVGILVLPKIIDRIL